MIDSREISFNDIHQTMGQVRGALTTNLVGEGAAYLADDITISAFAGQHYLAEGVPGVSKTEIAKNLGRVFGAGALGLSADEEGSPIVKVFTRAQGAPDRQPSDVLGSEVYRMDSGEYKVRKGPVFGHFLLLDELNRFRPNVQAALNEAGSERQVTIGDQTLYLPNPFMMIGTQNPHELGQGTYGESDAMIDRFGMSSFTGMPLEDERLVAMQRRADGQNKQPVGQVISVEDLVDFQEAIKSNVSFGPGALVFAASALNRVFTSDPSKFKVKAGGFRSGDSIVDLAKARSAMKARSTVEREDIEGLILPVVRHRLEVLSGSDNEGAIQQLVEDAIKSVSATRR